MPSLRLILEEPAWPDLRDKKEEVIDYQDPIEMTALQHGMESGATAVAMRFNLPDGRVVIAQTSVALLRMAVQGIMARYPDPPGVGTNAP